MEAIWFALIALMLSVYVVLDGFDFGVGIIHLRVAKKDAERRNLLAAIGPVWDGNEVWLIASGGVLVFAFPKAYAAAFSGFYLPLMVVLWLLILRGVSIECRSKVENPLWRSFWDGMFSLASTVLAIVLGVSLGNVLRGVPLDGGGSFHVSFFEDFRTGPRPGALDWYTILVGVFALVLLAAHGALYLNWKTSGPVQARSAKSALRLWVAVLPLGLIATIATAGVQPVLVNRLAHRPWAWPLPLITIAGAVSVPIALRRQRELWAFLGSLALIASLLLGTAAVMFPDILRSTLNERYSLTAANAANEKRGLLIGLLWWVPALLLAIGYFAYLFRSIRGKISVEAGEHGY
jgi:cytochrome d ubiquinol oxidase subunit II